MSNRRVTLLYAKARVDYASAPTIPTGLAASNTGATGTTLSWTPVGVADFYTLQRSTDQAAWTTVYTGAAATAPVTGLTPSTTYYFRVSATNGAFQSGWSANVQVTTLAASTPPATPAAPTASDVTDVTATLTWAAVTGATSYTLQRSLDQTTWTTVHTGAALTFTDTTLSPGTIYHYRLSASNVDGTSGWSPTTTITTQAASTLPPATPAAPNVTAVTTTSISLAWDPVPSATTYTLRRSTNGTTWANVFTGSATSRTDTGLTPGTSYQYQLQAANSSGVSAWSPTRTTSTSAGTAPNVRPVAASYIRQRSGACVHTNFNTALSVYKQENAEAICQRAAAMGLTHMRGLFPIESVARTWAAAFRRHSLQWLATIVPEGDLFTQPLSETRSKMERIRDVYADVIYAIEGCNEPNDKGAGWAAAAVAHQQVIWEVAKNPLPSGAPSPLRNKLVVGTSLLDTLADASYGSDPTPVGGREHYHQLLAEGILAYQDMAGLHSYPGGSYPTRKMDEGVQAGTPGRLDRIYDAYGANYPVWVSEWGYHNAMLFTRHNPATEATAGTYGPRGYLQILTQTKPNGPARNNMHLTYYEFLDDFDDPPKDNHEANFGMYAVSDTSAELAIQPSTWRAKPVATKVGNLLNSLRDPDGTPAYTPPLVVCDVSTAATNAELQWQVTATKAQADAGAASLWIWRNVIVENTTVLPVSVTVRDRVGPRNFSVNAEVQEIVLR